MAKNIRYRRNASEDNKSLGLILPDFVLCLRDFSLELSKGGKLITEDEYLEQSCAEQEGKADKFNKPRKCIRTHFPVRKCFTMPKPVERKDRLKELDRLQFNDLSDEFKEAINLFQSFVYSKKPKQLLTSNPVNGQMFAILTIHYIQTIRYGAGPDVDYAFRAVAKTELTRIGQEAVEIFSTQMQKVALPVTAVQLEKHYAKAQQAALAHLRKTVVHDNDIYLYYMADAQWEMDNIWNNMNKDNSKQVRNMCEAMLQEAYTKVLKGKIDIYKVLVAGGYSQFQHDIQMLKEDYVSTFRDFENHQIFWTWHGFMKTLQEAVSEIIKSDEALSQKEKEDERKRNEEQIEKIWKDQQDSQKEALEKQEKHFDEFRKECVKQTQENEIKYEALVAERLEKEEAEKEIARYKEEAG